MSVLELSVALEDRSLQLWFYICIGSSQYIETRVVKAVGFDSKGDDLENCIFQRYKWGLT